MDLIIICFYFHQMYIKNPYQYAIIIPYAKKNSLLSVVLDKYFNEMISENKLIIMETDTLCLCKMILSMIFYGVIIKMVDDLQYNSNEFFINE